MSSELEYQVFGDPAEPLFTSTDKAEAFAKAREFDAKPQYTDTIYIQDSDGNTYEDLTKA